MIQTLIKFPRKIKQIMMLFFDIIAVILSTYAAFSIRLGYLYYPSGDDQSLLIMFITPLIAIPIFNGFGFYRDVIRYMNFSGIWRIVKGTSIYSTFWGLSIFMLEVEFIPRSVIMINLILITFTIISSRLFIRWLLSVKSNNNILIYGAGSAGRQLSNALRESDEYNPVAFIDNSIELYHQSINGIKVYSQDDIAVLIEKHNITEVLLAMPSLTRTRHKEIVDFLTSFSIVVRTLPGLSAIAQGRVRVNDLLEINPIDLLGRDSVKPNKKLLKINISNKVVLVTGAGGSIGSELCRQIVFLEPKKLILFDVSESSLYQIDQELLSLGISNIEIFPVIGSVTNKSRVSNVINNYGVQTIYHAAAYKHVPLVESNKLQGIYNNAIGTMRIAEAAISENVEIFVLISTDKAVRPTSFMGVSKRIAELVLQAFAKQATSTCFTMVRFGNVLDSSGSVIPLFKKQIKDGGPITVTHPDVIRYFMTIPEAVELVIQAGAMAEGGEVFVLDMGEPVRIQDLAVKMIKLSGLQLRDENSPSGDIEIQFTGLRPGEKLYEELLVGDNSTPTENKLIMRAEEEMINWIVLEPILNEIEKAVLNSNVEKLYGIVTKLMPEYRPSRNNIDNLDHEVKI
jgi:FlaA1/EpsC-like NDP-sugar epimerase